MLIDLDTSVIVLDAGCFQVQSLDVGPATQGQQDFISFNVEEIIALPGDNHLFMPSTTGLHEARAHINVDALVRKYSSNSGRDLQVFFGQNAVGPLDNRYSC